MGISTENIIIESNVAHLLCSICAKLLDDAVVLRSCEHMYCRICIKEWMKSQKATGNKSVCPDCRQSFVKKDLIKPVSSGLQIMTNVVSAYFPKVRLPVFYIEFNPFQKNCT